MIQSQYCFTVHVRFRFNETHFIVNIERQTFDVIQSLPTDEKDKITRKVADVVESIDCKSVLISHPRATKIPAPADEHQLVNKIYAKTTYNSI